MDSFEEILSTMENAYMDKTGFVPDKYSDTGIRLRLFAGELFNIKTELSWFKRQMFPNTATGVYLDYHSEEKGITRKSAIKATGEVLFALDYAAEASVTIPKGTVVSTSDTVPLRFITTEEGTINVGVTYITLPAIAEEGGKGYNIAPQKIDSLITGVPGVVQVINLGGFSGGADKESDDELRERLLYAYKNPDNGTNIAFYKNLAESVEGVYSAGVIPCNRGVGTVDVFIAKEGEIADSGLVGKVSTLLTKAREVNVSVSVMTATAAMINVAVDIDLETGYEFNDVKARCEEAIRSYINSLGVGTNLYMSNVGEVIFHTEGVKCYAFDFDYSSDVLYGQSKFPVPNNIIINMMEEDEDE